MDRELIPKWEFITTAITKESGKNKGDPDKYAVHIENFELAIRNEGITDPDDRKYAMRLASWAASVASEAQTRRFVDEVEPVVVKPKQKSLMERLSPELAAKLLAREKEDGA